jgi:hypothetical protein
MVILYYRVQQVRATYIENVEEHKFSSVIVPVSVGTMIQDKAIDQSCGVDISLNGFDIHVTENTSMELLSSILQVIANVK